MQTPTGDTPVNRSFIRWEEPSKWYQSSHGFLIKKNGNQVEVKDLTQFCVLRWISHLFQHLGLDISEKLSFHHLISSQSYENEAESIYNKLIETTKEAANHEAILLIFNASLAVLPKKNALTSKSVVEESPPHKESLIQPYKEQVAPSPDKEQVAPSPASKPAKAKAYPLGLSKEEILNEIERNYSHKKSVKEDVRARLLKNAVFNRKQQLSESDDLSEKENFPTIDLENASNFPTTKEGELGYGASSHKGGRPVQQDAFLLAPEILLSLGDHPPQPACVYGVFDGHGDFGHLAANYVKNNFIKTLQSTLSKYKNKSEEEQMFFSCKETMKQLHKDCINHLKEKHSGRGGTTAVVAIVINKYVWVLNVGDSRAILVNKEGNVHQASTDSKPSDPRFSKKAIARGGKLTVEYITRVEGFATARAIGDVTDADKQEEEPIIAPNPKISRYSLEQFEGGRLVLACDGVWDVATSDQVGAVVHACRKKDLLESASQTAETIVKKAFFAGSRDNLTAVVVDLPLLASP